MTVPTFPLARIRVTVWSVVVFFLAVLALGAALLMQRMRQADLADSEAQVVHFAETLRSGKKPMGSVDEVLGVMQLMDAVYKSAELGKEVKVG